MGRNLIGFLDGSDFISPLGIKIIQSTAMGMKPGREIILASDPSYSGEQYLPMIMIPATRPSLRLPLTEEIAAADGFDLWYFNPDKWPDRIPVDPSEYLGIPRRTD